MEQQYEYLVLYQIGGSGDAEIWYPGSKIQLSAERAAIYLAAGLVRAIETTLELPQVKSDTIEYKVFVAGEPVVEPAVESAVEPVVDSIVWPTIEAVSYKKGGG